MPAARRKITSAKVAPSKATPREVASRRAGQARTQAAPEAVTPARRPGGRSAQVQSQVRGALEQLVAELGRDQVTVPMVAERAGVSASSIYRRWGDVSVLLTETATVRLDPDRPLQDTGDLQGDLTAWSRGLIRHLSDPTRTSLLKAAAALSSGEDTDCLRNRKAEAETLVKRAEERGEPTPQTRQVIDHIVAPIVFRLLFGGASIEPSMATRLVEELFSMMDRPVEFAAATSARPATRPAPIQKPKLG